MEQIQFVPLLMGEVEQYLRGLVEASPRLLAAVALILVTWGMARLLGALVSRLARRARLRRNLIDVLAMLTHLTVWLIGLLVAITLVFPTVTPAKALTTLGLGSLAVGFAFKDIFENFLAGLLILWREPFKIGDHIAVEEHEVEGLVELITVRDSHIRRTDGQRIVVPNALLFENPVIVRTDRDVRRTSIIVGIAYDEDVDAAREVIGDAVRHVDSVRDDVRDIQVFAKAFGESSIDFEVTWWTGSKPVDIRSSRDQVVAAIKRALDEHGIEIPFPYRTLVFKPGSPLPLASAQPEEGE
ncbi:MULTISPECIES: mechanosensitive ion channel family protein [unclassified Halomonas]|uniref:mechanosensitive ion channel family protein n=1 Tax=unclassified Halomonas TaxID=2609666 RepID=UPI0028857F06|nr:MULTISPECIES: mechanosensitive ion channel family protein [unclassified Halomonas]MDT0502352.1 mechanosensitive ion channel family protein [Halomonas sp. PAR7]MDT0510929.1 mechanosensitive ion channel family protein [Halomonas sp. LES1]MDT0592747.1 mechanosensitive ion channel family protein [Halomonas sp. PAR8]